MFHVRVCVCVMYANTHGFLFPGLSVPAGPGSKEELKNVVNAIIPCTPGEMRGHSQHVTYRSVISHAQPHQPFPSKSFFFFSFSFPPLKRSGSLNLSVMDNNGLTLGFFALSTPYRQLVNQTGNQNLSSHILEGGKKIFSFCIMILYRGKKKKKNKKI